MHHHHYFDLVWGVPLALLSVATPLWIHWVENLNWTTTTVLIPAGGLYVVYLQVVYWRRRNRE